MDNRDTNTNSNRDNKQCASNRELKLERELMKESTRLDNADTYNMPYEKSLRIYIRQEEFYKKWKLLKGIREARERLYDKENNEEQIYQDVNQKQETKTRSK